MDIHLGHVITPLSGSRELLDLPRGAVTVEQGRIMSITPWDGTPHPDATIHDHGECLIIPGFVDTHVHYPQIGAIAAPGPDLAGWLKHHIYPAEARFADESLADATAEFFTSQLIANGVTTAAVFATVHPGSVEALFRHAQRHNLRILSGKTCMDRNAPEELLDTPESALAESALLLDRWHGQGRLEYAITPRFALSSSPEQLRNLGELAAAHPEVLVQTHLAENREECEQVAKLFPDALDYTDVYEQAGLVHNRSIFAHALHLSGREVGALRNRGAAVAHCPSSNFFLGSGVFERNRFQGIPIGLGSDIGAGTSLCPLATLRAAHSAARLQGDTLDAAELLHLATLGGAEALGVDKRVGSLEAGKDADLVVLDPESSPILRHRADQTTNTAELLFAVIMLGDERAVAQTFIADATPLR
ncbi:Guanine deaminase [Corynebacterium occultum]|uniref:Guanine deaminase n=1 Tax=Corynebacterium occultum TaxID=2675219 RepID=A0A6B8WK47_9CORY|nr:guanine deaminase [Corynebacterium occultum]QGU06808.1 Guanine deaminase [Corynebacterium occultum]